MTTQNSSAIIVQLTSLPPTGLAVETTLDASGLNARLKEGRPTDIVFTGPAQVKFVVTPSIDGFLARGSIKAPYTQCCGRCDDRLPREVETAVNIVLKPRPAGTPMHDRDFAEDIGLSFYSGDSVDMTPLLEELLILQLSFFWHPPDLASGACSTCGIAPQRFASGEEPEKAPSQNFGNLLKEARKRGGQG